MNEQAQSPSKDEASELCIEEQIIAASKTNYKKLPMMEVLLSQFEEPLGLALTEYTSRKSEVTLKSFDYMSCAEVFKSFTTPSLFGVSNAKPWDGQLAIIAEPGLVFTMLQTMLGGRPSTKPLKPRNFTAIEKRIAAKFYGVILRELGRKFTDVTPVDFQIDKLEDDPEELSFAGACVKITMEVLLEEQGGLVTLIIPYTTFETVSSAFSQPFRGGKISGETGWRAVITKSLQDTDIELTAILQELTVPLHEVLAWHRGQILDIGIDSEHELLVRSGGKRMFRAAMGCRKNGSVALRISKTLSDEDN